MYQTFQEKCSFSFLGVNVSNVSYIHKDSMNVLNSKSNCHNFSRNISFFSLLTIKIKVPNANNDKLSAVYTGVLLGIVP